MARVVQPFINGHRYSYTSIEFVTAVGLQFYGVKAIQWSSSLEPGEIVGSDSVRVGRTPGKSKRTCSVEIYLHEAKALLGALGQSYGRKTFDVMVQYAETEDPNRDGNIEGVTVVEIRGCRITEDEVDNQEGPDATTMRLTLDPHDILVNGLSIDKAEALPDGKAA